MFEYKNDFLMGPKQTVDDQAEASATCQASRTAERQLAELADLVGNGSTLTRSAPKAHIDLIDDAPALEFDLEGELSRAFGSNEELTPSATPRAISPPQMSPAVKNAVFDTTALEAALWTQRHPETQSRQHHAEMAVVAPGEHPVEANVEPSVVETAVSAEAEIMIDEDELSEGLAEELDRALAEEVAADLADAGGDKGQDQFDAELARLMGTEPSRPVPASKTAPAPEVAKEPWSSPEVVQASEIPQHYHSAGNRQAAEEWSPPQTSDYDPVPANYADPSSQAFDAVVQDASMSAAVANFGSQPAGGYGDASHGEIDFEAAFNQALAEPTDSAEVSSRHSDFAEQGPVFAPASAHAFAVDPVFGEGSEHNRDGLDIPAAAFADHQMNKRRSGRRAAFAIIAVALLGGTAALGWNMMGSDAGPAPTLLASSEPIKVKPKDAGGKIVPNQDQAVYQSVDGAKSPTPAQPRLNDNTEKPIAVASAPVKAGERVDGNDATTTSGLPVQPRRVRTVVVKPDGTIVSSTQDVAQSGSTEVDVQSPTLALQPTSPVLENAAAPSTPSNEVAFNPPKPVETAAEAEQPVVAETEQVPAKPVEVKTVAVKPAEPAPKAVAKPAAKPAPAEVAKAEDIASVSSPYAVQIASQRSPEAAKKSYENMSRRYASIIGGKGVDIRKVTLSGQGTYYRVRIPAQSKSEAGTMCSQLKSAGGACFVTR